VTARLGTNNKIFNIIERGPVEPGSSKSIRPVAASIIPTINPSKVEAKTKYQNSLLQALPLKLFQFDNTEITASFMFIIITSIGSISLKLTENK
jgi:hypothetical protein